MALYSNCGNRGKLRRFVERNEREKKRGVKKWQVDREKEVRGKDEAHRIREKEQSLERDGGGKSKIRREAGGGGRQCEVKRNGGKSVESKDEGERLANKSWQAAARYSGHGFREGSLFRDGRNKKKERNGRQCLGRELSAKNPFLFRRFLRSSPNDSRRLIFTSSLIQRIYVARDSWPKLNSLNIVQTHNWPRCFVTSREFHHLFHIIAEGKFSRR